MSKKMNVDSEIDFCNISTSDGKLFRVERSMVNRWQTISDMLEFSDDANDDIPLPNVSSEVFELLKKWDNEHSYLKKGEGIPIKNNYGYECFDLKDEPRAFFKEINHKNKYLVFELIKVANYLNIPDLYRAGCRFIAMTIKEKKTAEGIRQYLEFPTPSPSHFAVVKYNNKWCEDL